MNRLSVNAAATCVALVLTLPAVAALAERRPELSHRSPTLNAPASTRFRLGPVLTVAGDANNTIFGFDVDQNGSDGLLAYGEDGSAAVDVFDQRTAKVTKVVARQNHSQNDYVANGIFAGDVGLVDEELAGNGGITPSYHVLHPVAGGHFTKSWTPPIARERVLGRAANQTTRTSVVFAIELNGNDVPDLLVSDIAANTFAPTIHLDPSAFALGAQPQIAQDTILDDAVLATSPDFGRVGGNPPLIETIDLRTHAIATFNGFNNGPFHAGYVNGLAVDPNTHVACTTTELNANVEFYDLPKRTGITVQLPNTGPGDQTNSGWSVAADPVHGLFLVTQPSDSVTGRGSAIYAFDEQGHVVGQLHGLAFSFPSIALNPSLRIGYVSGSNLNQLQEFDY